MESRGTAYRFTHGSGPGHEIWEAFDGRVLVRFGPFDVWYMGFHYVVQPAMEDGRLVCDSLTVDRFDNDGEKSGNPVGTDALRRAEVANWLHHAVESYVSEPDPAKGPGHWTGRHRWPPDDFAANGPTDEALEHLSQQYAWLMVQGRRPSGVFLDKYGIPRPTATKWLAAARRKGILVDRHERVR